MKQWKGNLSVYPEVHCEECNEIIHNHIDCPLCGEMYAETNSYGELESYEGVCEVQCMSCGAIFYTKDDCYASSSVWTLKEMRNETA